LKIYFNDYFSLLKLYKNKLSLQRYKFKLKSSKFQIPKMSQIRILQQGASALSKKQEVILVASSIIGTAALLHLLPERLHWGMSEAGKVASDNPDTTDKNPTENEELLDIILLDNPDIEPFSQITAQECGITRDMSFGQAFNQARDLLGPGSVFAWHGKLYNTFFKEEWSAMSPEDRQEFMNSIDFSYVPEDEIPPLPEPDPNPIMDPDDPFIDPDDPVIGGDTPGSDDDIIILNPHDDFPNNDITDILITPDDVHQLDDNIDFNDHSDIDGMA
jgi:hypothetical protein